MVSVGMAELAAARAPPSTETRTNPAELTSSELGGSQGHGAK